MMELTAFDKSLLNLLQANLPVCSHPYAKLAEQLGTEEDVVISRLQDLKAAQQLIGNTQLVLQITLLATGRLRRLLGCISDFGLEVTERQSAHTGSAFSGCQIMHSVGQTRSSK